MKKNAMRILGLLMTVAMLLCMLPATAMATESNTITITMTDSYGDGWNGNMLHMFIDGNFYSNLDLESGSEDTWSMEFTDSAFSFYWGKGEYAEECSFTIFINGETVYSIDNCSELADDQFIYTNCTHPDSYEETVDACCTLEGGTYVRCSKCHDIMDTLEIVPPTGHTFVDGVCSVCGDTPRLAIEMKDSYGDGWNDAAVEIYIDGENTETVTLTGESATWSIDYDENKLYVLKWVKGEYDSECQVRIFVNGLEEIGIYDFTDIADGEIIYSNCTHTYGDGEVVAPTCAEVGYTLYTCTTCGFRNRDTYTAATGHTEDVSATVVVPPTCTEGGYTEYLCSVCGEYYQLDEDWVEPIGHAYDENGDCANCGGNNRLLLYFKNTDGWENVYAYAYDAEQNSAVGAWPGYTMTLVENDIYSVELPYDSAYVVFNSGDGSQTVDLEIPTDGNNFYDGTQWTIYQSISLQYPTLSLEGEVKINVYFTLSDMNVDADHLGLAVFNTPQPDGTVDTASYVNWGANRGESEFVVFTQGIPAKKLGDMLYFKVVYQLDDGSYIYSDMKFYSGRLYAQNALRGDSNAKALSAALMNYGAQAQEFFDYNTDELMNSFMTEEQKALAPAYHSSMITGVTPVPSSQQGSFYPRSGFDTMYATSSLEGEIGLNYYFTVTNPEIAVLDAYYWYPSTLQGGDVFAKENAEERVFINQNSDGLFCFTRYLPASMINQPLYVAVTYIDNDDVEYSTGVLPYSFGIYLKNTIANGDDASVALAKATAVYCYLAQEYFMPAEA